MFVYITKIGDSPKPSKTVLVWKDLDFVVTAVAGVKYKHSAFIKYISKGSQILSITQNQLKTRNI